MPLFSTIKLAAAALMISAMHTTAYASNPSVNVIVKGSGITTNVFVDSKGAKDRFAPKGYMRDRNKNCLYRVYGPLKDEYAHWNGECDEAGYITGQGRLTFTYPNGAPGGYFRYIEAPFEAGHAMGQGRRVYVNGDVYSGPLNLDEMQGYGIYEFNDGTFYEGEFRNDRPLGQGVINNQNGETFKVVAKAHPEAIRTTERWRGRKGCRISLGSKTDFREALRWCMSHSLRSREPARASSITIEIER